jgi:hypothetical protein
MAPSLISSTSSTNSTAFGDKGTRVPAGFPARAVNENVNRANRYRESALLPLGAQSDAMGQFAVRDEGEGLSNALRGLLRGSELRQQAGRR